MTRVSASAFPALRRFFSGYLHEDFLTDAGSPEGALRTFWADASSDERRRFQREAKRFLADTSSLEFDAQRDLVQRLGGRWVPPTREALVQLLTGVEHLR